MKTELVTVSKAGLNGIRKSRKDLKACLQKLVNLTGHPYFPPIKDLPAWGSTLAEARELLSRVYVNN